MGRRKRQLLEDDFSDSSGSDDHSFDDPNEDADAKEERALFENPYKRKKRRKDGKEDSIYGVFASSDEDEGFSGKAKEARQRRDWTKAPAFVSKQTLDLTKEMDVDEQGTGGISSEGSEPDDEAVVSDLQEQSGSEKVSKSSSPRVREEQEEQEEGRPRFGGIGSKKPTALTSSTFSGFSRGGIGSFKPSTLTDASIVPAPSPPPPSVTAEADFPSAFGSSSRTQRSFLRNDDSASGNNSPRSATPLSSAEAAHFSKLGGSFGARMLGKMGWKAGMGLGVTGEGIAAPVESKLRPKGMGLAFKGFREKTEQSKVEARRRGEVVSDDEETPKAKKKGKKGIGKGETSDAWKKAKKVRVKVEHKTYEQIIAEAGEEAPPAIGQIIDATGATVRTVRDIQRSLAYNDYYQPREVASIADLSLASWTPTTEPMRLPELRHNLRLINEACKSDLDGLAREAKALGERKKWIHEEDLRLRKKVDEEAECKYHLLYFR